MLTGCAGLRPKRTLKGWVRTRMYQIARVVMQALGAIPVFAEKSKHAVDALRVAFSSQDYLATPAELRGSFNKIVREDLRPLLPQITQPTLLVWGEKDTATPLWMGELMQKELPNARLLVYEVDDHFAYFNQTARFATAVDAFLQEVAGA